MLAVFDIGNAFVGAGVFQDDRLRAAFRLATDVRRPAEEYAFLVSGLLAQESIEREEVDGIAIASVVPPLTEHFEELSLKLFGRALGSFARHAATSASSSGGTPPATDEGARGSSRSTRHTSAERSFAT